MKNLLPILFLLALSKSNAQSSFGSNVADSLGNYQFYFVGQAHNNKANPIVEKELLLALNSKYDVQYDILEYAHSAAFLVNQYLESGQDSILSFINAEANFNFIRATKLYNDTTGNKRKIRFYGLDFEIRHEGKYTRKAIEIILQLTQIAKSEILSSLLRNVSGSSPKDLPNQLTRLKNYLKENDDKCRLLLGKYFVDILLIANAQYKFSPNRDEPMFDNFKRLYKELTKNGEQPSFFGSFGTGHINPRNNSGIAMRLLKEKDSPVRNKVCIIGVQYFNCQFDKEKPSKPVDGSLEFLCKSSEVAVLSSMKDEKKETINFLPREKLGKLHCNKAIEELSGLIVICNFGVAPYWTWE